MALRKLNHSVSPFWEFSFVRLIVFGSDVRKCLLP
jgi:hypothetical protein